MKKADPNPKANRHILLAAYGMAALFAGLILYFAWFLQVKSDTVIISSYNPRLESFSDRVVRGEILSNDGRVLASTTADGAGNEVRSYPYGPLFSHVVGYTSKGKTGLEALANFYLVTSHVNLVEQVVYQLSSKKNPGDNVVTTLDADLQKVAFDALGNRRGAVVAMEPSTGKVLAMVSKPDFDPNTLAAKWDQMVSDKNQAGQLLNRATQGLYPPGSTFKIVTALEYMRENPHTYEDFQFDCNGTFKYQDYSIQCYHGEAHGHEDFTQAFANSCNGAFADIGLTLDLTRLKATAGQLLFNHSLPIALPYNQSSYTLAAGADPWQILQTSIGQGATLMTPMHSLMITAAIANGGLLMKPYFIDHVENAGGDRIKKFGPKQYGRLMTLEEASRLTELMKAVVTEGTATVLKTEAYTAAGKTGSAEFDKTKETHSWFTGFAPADQPRLSVTVIVEEGGSGGKTAAPIAKALFDAYFSK